MVKSTINILGSCIVRDCFGFHEDNGGYEIKRFLNFFSPVYMFDKGIEIKEEDFFSEEHKAASSGFGLRCMYLEITKNILKYIEEEASDYLIIDLVNVRADIFELEGGVRCFKCNKKIYKKMAKEGLIPKVAKTVSFSEIGRETLRERMALLAEKVKELYPVDRIILFETFHVPYVLSRQNGRIYRFRKFERSRRQNEQMAFCFDVLREHLKGCHVVRMPDQVLADADHKWGEEAVHYTMEYYNYGLNAVDVITADGTKEEKDARVEELRSECSEMYRLLYTRYRKYHAPENKVEEMLRNTLYELLRGISHIVPKKMRSFVMSWKQEMMRV